MEWTEEDKKVLKRIAMMQHVAAAGQQQSQQQDHAQSGNRRGMTAESAPDEPGRSLSQEAVPEPERCYASIDILPEAAADRQIGRSSGRCRCFRGYAGEA